MRNNTTKKQYIIMKRTNIIGILPATTFFILTIAVFIDFLMYISLGHGIFTVLAYFMATIFGLYIFIKIVDEYKPRMDKVYIHEEK